LDPLLSVQDLSKSFVGLQALQNVSFDIPSSRIVGLIGPNGAGKTTLINIVSGHIPTDTGRILLNGQDATNWPPHRVAAVGRIARTYQNIRLFGDMSVLENVIVGYHSHMTTNFLTTLLNSADEREQEKTACAKALSMLEYVGLADKATRIARELSYGERRRVEIARALMLEPQLLLLDEPSAGMNRTEAKEIADLVAAQRDRGLTVLFIEHNMHMVMGLSDRVVVLNFGRVIADGEPDEVKRSDAVIEAYLGSTYARS
jgi:ABC-type branched-subunit amino acid transport system ATPase component